MSRTPGSRQHSSTPACSTSETAGARLKLPKLKGRECHCHAYALRRGSSKRGTRWFFDFIFATLEDGCILISKPEGGDGKMRFRNTPARIFPFLANRSVGQGEFLENVATAPQVRVSFHDDGAVLLHGGRGLVFSINRTGAMIWRGVEDRRPVNSIAAQLSEDFRIDSSEALAQAQSFVDRLLQEGLLVGGNG